MKRDLEDRPIPLQGDLLGPVPLTSPKAVVPLQRPVPLVVAVSGTDFHPFDRLVGWMDDWVADQAPDSVRTVVQYGYSRPPAHGEGQRFLGYGELNALFGAARAVVCHGGPSTIIEASRQGLMPVVVPRDPDQGEHVDGHQQRFARFLGGRGLVHLAESESAFRERLSRALADEQRYGGITTDEDAMASAMRLSTLVDELIAEPRGRRLRLPFRGGSRSAGRSRR